MNGWRSDAHTPVDFDVDGAFSTLMEQELKALEPAPTVMLVDDDDIDLEQFRRQVLRHQQYGQIVTFNSPEEALVYLGREDRPTIEVLFLDMRMPTMSGFTFLKQATAAFGQGFIDTIVILTTLSLAEMHLERATADPYVRAYLKKPLTAQDLDRVAQIVSAVRAAKARSDGQAAEPGTIQLASAEDRSSNRSETASA